MNGASSEGREPSALEAWNISVVEASRVLRDLE